MAITKDGGRQWPIYAEVEFSFGDPTEATATAAIDIPPNATIIGGSVMVDVAWDSATTAALDVGDAVDPNRYTVSTVDMKTLGATALDLTGYKYSTYDTIDVVLTNVGAPTVGTARLAVQYVIEGRAHENHPVQS